MPRVGSSASGTFKHASAELAAKPDRLAPPVREISKVLMALITFSTFAIGTGIISIAGIAGRAAAGGR